MKEVWYWVGVFDHRNGLPCDKIIDLNKTPDFRRQ